MRTEIGLLSIVVPMFNEASGIVEFCGILRPVLESLGLPYEVVFVDDGSSDDCTQRVLAEGWPQARVIVLGANVGHQLALDAGIIESQGNWILTMDADGQHPAEMIPAMVEAASVGNIDVVYTRRVSRAEESRYRRVTALAYYRLIRLLTGVPIVDSQADFRLMSRRVVDCVENVRGERILRLLLPSIGVRSVSLEYQARPRIAGESRYGIGRQIRLAVDSAFAFSSKPLRMVAAMGWILALAAFLWLIGVIITYFSSGTVAGWSSVMAAVLFVGGVSLLGQAIIGSYIARIHDMVKNQPSHYVAETLRSEVRDS